MAKLKIIVEGKAKENIEDIEQYIEDCFYGSKTTKEYIKVKGKFIKLYSKERKVNVETKGKGDITQYFLYKEFLENLSVVSDSRFNIYLVVKNPDFVHFYLKSLGIDVELVVKPIYGLIIKLPTGLTYPEIKHVCNAIKEVALERQGLIDSESC